MHCIIMPWGLFNLANIATIYPHIYYRATSSKEAIEEIRSNPKKWLFMIRLINGKEIEVDYDDMRHICDHLNIGITDFTSSVLPVIRNLDSYGDPDSYK